MLSRTPHDRGEPTMDGRDFHLPADAARDVPADLDTSALQSPVLAVDASAARRGAPGGVPVGDTDEAKVIDPNRQPA